MACRGRQGCKLRLCRETHRSGWVKKERIYVDMVDFGRDSSPQLQNSLAPVQSSGVEWTGRTGPDRAGPGRAGQEEQERELLPGVPGLWLAGSGCGSPGWSMDDGLAVMG